MDAPQILKTFLRYVLYTNKTRLSVFPLTSMVTIPAYPMKEMKKKITIFYLYFNEKIKYIKMNYISVKYSHILIFCIKLEYLVTSLSGPFNPRAWA